MVRHRHQKSGCADSRERGFDVVWRLYGDTEAGTPPRADDYTGWFPQHPSRLATARGGLMVSACGQHEGALLVHLTLSGDDAPDLCEAAYKVMAGFPGSEVRCGNCHLSTDEWQTYLASGDLPDRIQV